MPSYPTPEPIQLILRIPAGRIEIAATDTRETTVEVRRSGGRATGQEAEDDVRIEFRDSRRGPGQLLAVVDRNRHGWFARHAAYLVRIETPSGADVHAVTASAAVAGTGSFGSVNVRTASGEVAFDDVTDRVSIKSASGDVRVRDVKGPAELASTSGDIHVGAAAGRVSASLVSGDFKVDDAAQGVTARTVSGDLSIQAVASGEVDLNTVSGDALIAVRPGKRIWMDVRSTSGHTSCDLDADGDARGAAAADVDIRVKTVSGDVRITRAPEARDA